MKNIMSWIMKIYKSLFLIIAVVLLIIDSAALIYWLSKSIDVFKDL